MNAAQAGRGQRDGLQQGLASVQRLDRGLQETITPLTQVKEHTALMSAEQLALLEAQQQQLANYIA